MRHYEREFKKFVARDIKSNFPITAIRMERVLCQDILFDLNNKFTATGANRFSGTFFYDFFKITAEVDFNSIYVIDGVKFLHEHSGTGKPLVRDRALYKFLYTTESSNTSYAEALATNPWLNDLSNTPTRLMSEKVFVVRNAVAQLITKEIMSSAIINKLSDKFTPRGVWGYDYMFRWKELWEKPELELTPQVTLIPLAEYVQSFEEVREHAVIR